jgi:hypothetical protein
LAATIAVRQYFTRSIAGTHIFDILKAKMAAKSKNGSSISGLFFVGCMFIGVGMGFFFGNIPVGALIGMGVGFLVMGIIRVYFSSKNEGSDD